jgi:hypothetical protein
MKNSHVRAKRDDVIGWSDKTARSNTRFLQSVSLDGLDGVGFAFTLTIKNCPETHADWHSLRTAFLKRLHRMGMVRLHWVTEWQRRGVPHLHGVVYFPEVFFADLMEAIYHMDRIIEHWLEVSARYVSTAKAQNIKPISDSLGWLQYLAKHASRGAGHYQRSRESMPEGWKKTGRMWGKGGTWVTREPMKFDLDRRANFAYRRLQRSYRIAQARSSKNPSSVKFARRMLTCNLRGLSEVRGTSGWIPEAVTLTMLSFLHSQGYSVTQ